MIERWDERVTDLQDEYTLLSELGLGGNAVVYRARHRARAREVMIRLLPAPAAALSDNERAQLARLIDRVASLQHHHIIPLHAVHRLHDGGLALVSPHLPIRTLRQSVAVSGALGFDQVERLLVDVANALAYALDQGMVHQDLSPDSIYLEIGTGRALLGDFGFAREVGLMGGQASATARANPVYCAPEQANATSADARANIYSLGLIAWELLTGRSLSSASESEIVSISEVLPPIDSLRPGEVPLRMQYIVERMLRRDPHTRFAGAHGLLPTLNSWVVPSDWEAWEQSLRERCDSIDPTRVAATLSTTPERDALLPFERDLKEEEPAADDLSTARDGIVTDRETSDHWKAFEPIGVAVDAPAASNWRWIAIGVAALVMAVAGLAVFWPPFGQQFGGGGASLVSSAPGTPVSGGSNGLAVAPGTATSLIDERRKCSVMNAQIDCMNDEGTSDELSVEQRESYGRIFSSLKNAYTGVVEDPLKRNVSLVVLLLLGGGGVFALRRKPIAERMHVKHTPLFGGLTPSSATAAIPGGASAGSSAAWRSRRVSPKSSPVSLRQPVRAGNSRVAEVREHVAPAPKSASRSNGDVPVNESGQLNLAKMLGTMTDGHLVHFGQPLDGAMPELPGRLIISSGFDNGREIRFVESPGADGSAITFGRSIGEMFRHVQLEDETISRTHARMELIGGSWRLLNLARANGVVLNSEVMAMGEERPLHDGDAIEMGDVLFTFQWP